MKSVLDLKRGALSADLYGNILNNFILIHRAGAVTG
jgi:hypothetical protein